MGFIYSYIFFFPDADTNGTRDRGIFFPKNHFLPHPLQNYIFSPKGRLKTKVLVIVECSAKGRTPSPGLNGVFSQTSTIFKGTVSLF